MPTMKPKELIRLLEKDGWEYVPSNGGSHQNIKRAFKRLPSPTTIKIYQQDFS